MAMTPQRGNGKFQWKESVVAIAITTSDKICDYNPNRVTLIISTAIGGSGYLRLHDEFTDGLPLKSGWSLNSFSSHQLKWCDHGGLVTAEWYFYATGTAIVYVIEQTYHP